MLHLPTVLMSLELLQRDEEWFGLELQFRDCLAFDMAKTAWPNHRRELCSDNQYTMGRENYHLMGESNGP